MDADDKRLFIGAMIYAAWQIGNAPNKATPNKAMVLADRLLRHWEHAAEDGIDDSNRRFKVGMKVVDRGGNHGTIMAYGQRNDLYSVKWDNLPEEVWAVEDGLYL